MPSRQPTRKDAVQTRAALLAAAAEEFARHGFKEAKVREMCAKAGVNLGAVSHYFGSKEALYHEVLVIAHREMIDREPLPRIAPGEAPRTSLKNCITYMLRFLLLRRATHPYAGRLITWELREPTSALDELVAKVARPVRESAERAISAVLGEADEPHLRGLCANFVQGLCVSHELGGELMRRFGHPVPRTEAEVMILAEAMTEFALGGIERLAKAKVLRKRK